MIELTRPQIEYLSSQRLGRLATAGANGKPHVVPRPFGTTLISAPSTSADSPSGVRGTQESTVQRPNP